MESNIYFVVSYFNSTSNHNQRRFCNQTQLVVSYFNSTSNHNMQPAGPSRFRGCFLFQFYIKPQPYIEKLDEFDSCFLFQFYIKPQHPATARADVRGCFLFQFYIKPQQTSARGGSRYSCFLFQFYIKPQQGARPHRAYGVVSYFNSTSNHNRAGQPIHTE